MAIGSLFQWVGKSLWFIGDGKLILDGAPTTIAASTDLQFLLYNSPSANPQYYTDVVYKAGLPAPAAPTVAAGGASTRTMTGTYSVRLTAIRGITGAESNASVQSNVISLTGTKISVPFPAAVGNGHDLWGVYVTQANYGARGPHISLPPSLTGESPIGFVKETTVAAAGSRTLEFEWGDGDLVQGDLAPFENNQPPKGVFAFTLEGCMAIVGCYAGQNATTVTNRGSMIAVSRAGFPEAYPADVNHLLALPEEPSLVLARAAGGYVYIAGKNSLSVVRYTGSTSKAPLALSVLWPDIGFTYPWNACLAEGQLYGYVGNRGLIRISSDEGAPDTTFAMAVQSDFDGISDADVMVGYDPQTNHVVWGYTTTVDEQSVIRLYCFNKSSGLWSTPILSEEFTTPITGTLKNMYTNNGKLYLLIDVGDDNWISHEFNRGNGSRWALRSAWRDAKQPEVLKTIQEVRSATGNNSSNETGIRIYKDLDPDTVVASKVYVPKAKPEHLRIFRTNVRNAKSFAFEVYGEDDNSVGLEIASEGYSSKIGA